MPKVNRAIASPVEELTGNLQFFTLYTDVNIIPTGDYKDTSQKTFDNFITLISTRAQPVIVAHPYAVVLLENEGSTTLTGAGYVFKFVVEHAEVFASISDDSYQVDDPTYHLKFMFDEIEIEGVQFNSSGINMNIEFTLHDQL